jgi:hypothetical protein
MKRHAVSGALKCTTNGRQGFLLPIADHAVGVPVMTVLLFLLLLSGLDEFFG